MLPYDYNIYLTTKEYINNKHLNVMKISSTSTISHIKQLLLDTPKHQSNPVENIAHLSEDSHFKTK